MRRSCCCASTRRSTRWTTSGAWSSWRIRDGILVASEGRGGDGFLEIDVRKCPEPAPGRAKIHVEVEIASFYPAIALRLARWVYANTQSRIHVLVTHGFLRSLAKLELEESAVGRFATVEDVEGMGEVAAPHGTAAEITVGDTPWPAIGALAAGVALAPSSWPAGAACEAPGGELVPRDPPERDAVKGMRMHHPEEIVLGPKGRRATATSSSPTAAGAWCSVPRIGALLELTATFDAASGRLEDPPRRRAHLRRRDRARRRGGRLQVGRRGHGQRRGGAVERLRGGSGRPLAPADQGCAARLGLRRRGRDAAGRRVAARARARSRLHAQSTRAASGC